ncbi:MAG: 30S ribosomal protein S7 [candidate division KSB1 bacterium]|jgi:small subunit ribosomal protein S7|nr:30S ribosomal protein S7 [candidate division KSB1 bacterium]
MSRRKRVIPREILPDPKYKSVVVTKFINGLMTRGKKSTAEKIFYDAIDAIEAKTKKDGLEVFNKALTNVKPVLEVKSRRVGGATYQVPVEVSEKRRQALSIRWIIGFARNRNEKTMYEKLASELIAASQNEGPSIKKRDDTHKMAEANKAFAHFRW